MLGLAWGLHLLSRWGRRAEDPFRGLRAGPVRYSPLHFRRAVLRTCFRESHRNSPTTPRTLSTRRKCARKRGNANSQLKKNRSRSGAVRKLRRGKPYVPRTCVVIAEREREHDRQPEDRAYDDKLGALGTIAGVHDGHAEIEGEIKLAVEVNVRVDGESLIHFLFLQGQFLKVIAGHGMRRMVLHVKAVAGDEMVVEFLLVFDGLDAKKDGAKTKRGDQENTDPFLLANLRGPDGHGHGQTAHNQHNGVAGAKCDVKSVTANAESGAESAAIDGVSEKHAAEEQDFRDEENPHAKRGGFLLLLEGLKLPVQIAGAMHAGLLFLSQIFGLASATN